MRSFKTQKIDLNTEYPCPCRHRGHLQPIILTEAFGCNRCQQIFVVENNHQVIDQLSTTYPYKRSWRWTGYRWKIINSRLQENSLSFFLSGANVISWTILLLLLAILTMLIMGWLQENYPSFVLLGANIISWTIFALLLAIVSVWWLAYRR